MKLRAALSQRDLERLHVLVLGPGKGESVLVGAPGGAWLVVDSFARSTVDRHPPLEALTAVAAEPAAVALTHPHLDHAQGLGEVIDAARAGAAVGALPPLVDEPAPIWRGAVAAAVAGKQVKTAIAAVKDAWAADDLREWRLWAGESLPLGDAEVTVLHPRSDLDVAAIGDPNELSCPMLVKWGDVRVLLAADLPKPGWTNYEQDPERPAAGPWRGVKSPHHMSDNALHDAWSLVGTAGAPVFSTPWVIGGNTLPDFAPGGGCSQLLAKFGTVALTGLATKLPRTAEHAARIADLHAGRAVITTGDLTLEDARTPPVPDGFDLADHFVLLSFAGDGTVDVKLGDGALKISP